MHLVDEMFDSEKNFVIHNISIIQQRVENNGVLDDDGTNQIEVNGSIDDESNVIATKLKNEGMAFFEIEVNVRRSQSGVQLEYSGKIAGTVEYADIDFSKYLDTDIAEAFKSYIEKSSAYDMIKPIMVKISTLMTQAMFDSGKITSEPIDLVYEMGKNLDS